MEEMHSNLGRRRFLKRAAAATTAVVGVTATASAATADREWKVEIEGHESTDYILDFGNKVETGAVSSGETDSWMVSSTLDFVRIEGDATITCYTSEYTNGDLIFSASDSADYSFYVDGYAEGESGLSWGDGCSDSGGGTSCSGDMDSWWGSPSNDVYYVYGKLQELSVESDYVDIYVGE